MPLGTRLRELGSLHAQRNSVNSFSIQYRISGGEPGVPTAPLASHRLKRFAFADMDMDFGTLRMSVEYCPSATVTILEQTTAPPPLPQIIADYIGGLTASAGSRQGPHARDPAATSNLSASLQLGDKLRLPDPSCSPPVTSGTRSRRSVQPCLA